MANRIRSIYPDVLESMDFASWSPWAQIAFVKIWTKMDDKGRIKDDPKWLAAVLFAFNRDVVTPEVMESIIREWVLTGSVCRYEAGGQKWLHCVNWQRFQKPNRPTPSRIPQCPIHEGSVSTHGALTADSLPEGRGVEWSGEEREGSARSYFDRCPAHEHLAVPPKCGACADVRKSREHLQEIAAAPLSRCLIHATVYKGVCPGCAADEKAGNA